MKCDVFFVLEIINTLGAENNNKHSSLQKGLIRSVILLNSGLFFNLYLLIYIHLINLYHFFLYIFWKSCHTLPIISCYVGGGLESPKDD